MRPGPHFGCCAVRAPDRGAAEFGDPDRDLRDKISPKAGHLHCPDRYLRSQPPHICLLIEGRTPLRIAPAKFRWLVQFVPSLTPGLFEGSSRVRAWRPCEYREC